MVDKLPHDLTDRELISAIRQADAKLRDRNRVESRVFFLMDTMPELSASHVRLADEVWKILLDRCPTLRTEIS